MKKLFILMLTAACQSNPPKDLGASNMGQCPSSPNCVSSLTTSKEHFIEPFQLRRDPQTQFNQLKTYLKDKKSVVVTVEEDNYLRSEWTSSVFRFVDDVEFLLQNNLIHIRSASRLGHSDLGANRKRIEDIRFKLDQNEL